MIQKAKTKHLSNQENLRSFKDKKQEGYKNNHVVDQKEEKSKEPDKFSYTLDISKKPNNNFETKNIVLKTWDPSDHPFSVALSNIILKDYNEYSSFINKVQVLKDCIVDYLYNKKINFKEIQIKLKKEEESIKKEQIDLKKNLEDKVSLALEKANSCLDNIKNLGKKSDNKSIKFVKTQKKIDYREIPNTEKTFDDLMKNLTDKYKQELSINQSNMDSYFLNLAQNRNKIKEFKEKLKRINTKNKSIQDTFNKIYKKNKRDVQCKKSESCLLIILNKEIEVFSLIESDIFKNLYLQVMYNSKSAKDYSEDDICNIFSFWYIVKHLKTLLGNKNNNEIFEKSIKNLLVKQKYQSSHKYCKNNATLDYTLKNINSFFYSLYPTKNLTLEEENLFDKNFYKLYDLLINRTKLNLCKTITPFIRQELSERTQFITSSKVTNKEKEILLLLKWVNSVIFNNGNNSLNIFKNN
jgi:hypothetical protein